MKKIIDLHIEQGAEGFYVMGGTGEGIATAREEREIMCELSVRYNAGRKPIINHIRSQILMRRLHWGYFAKKSNTIGSIC